MKIAVYSIETVAPQHESEEYFEILNILNLPSLKHGTAEFIGKFLYYITKSELKTRKAYTARYYDRTCEVWREGVVDLKDGVFIQYAGKN